MQDYISIKTDINGNIPGVTVKQFDCNSRFLHVTLTDSDLPADDNGIFEMTGCSARLLVSLGHDKYEYVDGEIADAEGGIVSFTLPGSVTQRAGTYTCEIRITEPNGGSLISTKPFKLTVETSLDADEAIEATPQYSALENALMTVGRNDQIVRELTTLAESGEIPAGTVEAEVAAARVGWDGTPSDNLAQAMTKIGETGLVYLGKFLNTNNWASATIDGSTTFAGLPNNIFAVCDVDEGNDFSVPDAPVHGTINGTIITFGRMLKGTHIRFDTQIFIPQSCDKLFVRKCTNVDGTNWSNWNTMVESEVERLTGAYPHYRGSAHDDNCAVYHHHLYELTDDGAYFISDRTITENGVEVKRWNDLPMGGHNFMVFNSRYVTNWILQTAIPSEIMDISFQRQIPRPGFSAQPKQWVYTGTAPDPRMKVLAVGDSICEGWRNGGKGFIGDFVLESENIGVNGAGISTVRSTDNIEDIPSIFQDFVNAHSKSVKASNDGWTPDLIISNGGHNDYFHSAPLGQIPTMQALNSNGQPDYSSLDLSTVMGGLQRLFLLMIENYPKAKKFFLTPHKIYRNVPNSSKNGYMPTQNNDVGYNETQLTDAIIACCKVYGVKVIDIFNESPINSMNGIYRGAYYYGAVNSNDPNYREDRLAPSDTTNYFDRDGVHPLERGYLEGYVPLIREAIRTGTVKS